LDSDESHVNIDPELTRQLAAATPNDTQVEAVFILASDDPLRAVPSPEQTEELIHQVLKRVESRVGKREGKLNIFRNLGSFVVLAHPTFVQELMSQPEIAAAMANRHPDAKAVSPQVPRTRIRKQGEPNET